MVHKICQLSGQNAARSTQLQVPAEEYVNVRTTYSTGTNTTATINSNSTGPNNVSVTSPSVSQLQSNVNKLTGLSDVNAATLNDGAMIQYDDNSKKFVTRNEIKTESGNLILNGGTF